jgi:hypothetical protein
MIRKDNFYFDYQRIIVKTYLRILIIMTEYDITIINHIFGYNVRVSQKTFRNLYSTFIKTVEHRRTLMETEYKNNVKHSIQTIIKRIDEAEKTITNPINVSASVVPSSM